MAFSFSFSKLDWFAVPSRSSAMSCGDLSLFPIRRFLIAKNHPRRQTRSIGGYASPALLFRRTIEEQTLPVRFG